MIYLYRDASCRVLTMSESKKKRKRRGPLKDGHRKFAEPLKVHVSTDCNVYKLYITDNSFNPDNKKCVVYYKVEKDSPRLQFTTKFDSSTELADLADIAVAVGRKI